MPQSSKSKAKEILKQVQDDTEYFLYAQEISMEKTYYVYIITNKLNSVLYIGITSNLVKRIWEHKNKVVDGFSNKYNLNKLVYYEICNDIEQAIKREKQLKNWHRAWKDNLIKEYVILNLFQDLYNIGNNLTMLIKNKEEIKRVLENDGVIAYVTDTVWGLGCLPSSEKAVKKIYDIKKREAQKPLILMSNETYHLLNYVQIIPKTGQKLIKKYFPGALTLVVKKNPDLTPDYITSGMATVGIRVPDNEVFKEICEIAPGHVLATTSANLSHQPSAKTYEQAKENMEGLADLVIDDYGCFCKGLESTVAGIFDDDEIKIFRQGAIKIE